MDFTFALTAIGVQCLRHIAARASSTPPRAVMAEGHHPYMITVLRRHRHLRTTGRHRSILGSPSQEQSFRSLRSSQEQSQIKIATTHLEGDGDSIMTYLMMMTVALLTTAAAQPLPLQKQGQCPSGYRESGSYCAPASSRAPVAIPKERGQCPAGFMQSGNYCIEMRARR